MLSLQYIVKLDNDKQDCRSHIYTFSPSHQHNIIRHQNPLLEHLTNNLCYASHGQPCDIHYRIIMMIIICINLRKVVSRTSNDGAFPLPHLHFLAIRQWHQSKCLSEDIDHVEGYESTHDPIAFICTHSASIIGSHTRDNLRPNGLNWICYAIKQIQHKGVTDRDPQFPALTDQLIPLITSQCIRHIDPELIRLNLLIMSALLFHYAKQYLIIYKRLCLTDFDNFDIYIIESCVHTTESFAL